MLVLKQFAILFTLGSWGILLLIPSLIPVIQKQLATLPTEVAAEVPPLWIVLFLQAIQVAVLLAIAVLIGIFCTPAVGLRSHLIEYWVLHPSNPISWINDVKWGLGIGTAATVITLSIRLLLEPVLPEALRVTNQPQPSIMDAITGMFYGGITEEILTRWGLMSLLVWLGWKLCKQGLGMPSHVVYQSAIVLAAVVFGLLHLPLISNLTPITGWVIVYAILLNGIVGIACGWLFWQYSLESAMIAHASFHVYAFALNVFLTKFI
jgi:Type II CAAX prenyl endopeptidase Rce1-like